MTIFLKSGQPKGHPVKSSSVQCRDKQCNTDKATQQRLSEQGKEMRKGDVQEQARKRERVGGRDRRGSKGQLRAGGNVGRSEGVGMRGTQ